MLVLALPAVALAEEDTDSLLDDIGVDTDEENESSDDEEEDVDDEEEAVDDEDAEEEEADEEDSASEDADDASSEEAADEDESEDAGSDAGEPSPLALPGFLAALHLGPFASFGGLVGGMADLELQFKLIEWGYLSVSVAYYGGRQIDAERDDSLVAGLLGYRHYLPVGSAREAVSVMGGASLGYYLTGALEDGSVGFDWTHFGVKAAGTYHWFLGNRISLGAGLGLFLAYQFNEYLDAAENFVIFMPEARFTLTF